MFGALGTHVVYLSSNGKKKTALVIGDPTTIEVNEIGGANDGAVPPLANGERHLMVFSPTGSVYVKHNVPKTGSDGASANHWYQVTNVEV